MKDKVKDILVKVGIGIVIVVCSLPCTEHFIGVVIGIEGAPPAD